MINMWWWISAESLVVVIAIEALALLASNTVANLFLLAIALILAHVALVLTAVSTILALIRSATLLPAILPVVRVSQCHHRRSENQKAGKNCKK